MTTYRLWPATNGGNAVAFGGNFISGTSFAVAGGGKWLTGYWWWVAATGQSTSPVKCALWSATSLNTGVVIPAATVTSGTLTPGQWNFIPLSAPVQLAASLDPGNSTNGSAYIAAVGVNGAFPDTNGYWAGAGAGAAGIANGPLTAYSAQSGSLPGPYGLPQGLFATGGSDPSVTMPNQASSVDNFWVDVAVSDAAPGGYAGSYLLWPNKADANGATSADTTTGDTVTVEVSLTQACTLNRIWYYSPPGAAALATWAGVYPAAGTPGVTAPIAQVTSPSWSAAAASGWVHCDLPANTTLAPGDYKFAVAGPASQWGPKDAGTGYWTSGVGSNGITNGPLAAPQVSAASLAFTFNGNPAGNPPYSDGTTQRGQPTFAMSSPAYPYLYAPVSTPSPGSSQNYWVQPEVTPLAAGSGALMSAGII